MNPIEAMTGLSGKKRPTRRGGRRHGKKPTTAADHHADVNAAMAQGDHAAAKVSALQLAKVLHAMQQRQTPKPTAGAESDPASDPTAVALL